MSGSEQSPFEGSTGLATSQGRTTSRRMNPVELVLSRLDGVKKAGGSRWSARCPAHPDNTPSLSLAEGRDGRVLVFCHAGCSFTEVVQGLGLRPKDLFPWKG